MHLLFRALLCIGGLVLMLVEMILAAYWIEEWTKNKKVATLVSFFTLLVIVAGGLIAFCITKVEYYWIAAAFSVIPLGFVGENYLNKL